MQRAMEASAMKHGSRGFLFAEWGTPFMWLVSLGGVRTVCDWLYAN